MGSKNSVFFLFIIDKGLLTELDSDRNPELGTAAGSELSGQFDGAKGRRSCS